MVATNFIGGERQLLYEVLAQKYDEIEKASGSIEKTNIFSDLLKETPRDLVGKVLALTIGKLFPDWKGEPELGVAERTAVQIVAAAASVPESAVFDSLRRTGDIGVTGESLLQEGIGQMSLFPQEITITSVHDIFLKVTRASGSGSNKEKLALLVGLLNDAKPIEIRYLLRTITGTMRLGLGYMGIMDALSIAFAGDKKFRPEIESAFNVCSDLVEVASLLATEGLRGLEHIKAKVGIPIRMMAAKKLSSAAEIIEKAGGSVLVEYKYDGERVQVHKDGEKVVLFSRRQEVITYQYPDVVEYVRKHVKPSTCVLEGECLAIDPLTNRIRPFQDLMRRRRKTGIEEMQKEIPVVIRFFDILYSEGEDVTSKPMLTRRELLSKAVDSCDVVDLTIGEVIDHPDALDAMFAEAIDSGHEGIIAKAIHKDSTYQAGSRSWLWIKLKASYQEGMTDSVDLVVVGAMHGRGKRTGVYGTILASAYDPVNDTYPTVCKIGTGFSDDVLIQFKDRLDIHRTEAMDPRVLSDIQADIWFEPVIVIEVLGDEITISPTHHAGRGQINGGGLAIRFPRFTGRWRDDKEPHQATTIAELIEIFENQKSRST